MSRNLTVAIDLVHFVGNQIVIQLCSNCIRIEKMGQLRDAAHVE